MTHHQSALTTLIGEVLAAPELAHQDVFRRVLQAGLQDLIDGEDRRRPLRTLPGTHDPPQRDSVEDVRDSGR